MIGNQVWGLIPLVNWLKWQRSSRDLSKSASGSTAVQSLRCLVSQEHKGSMPSPFPKACIKCVTRNRCYFLRSVYFNSHAIAEQVPLVYVQDLSYTQIWGKEKLSSNLLWLTLYLNINWIFAAYSYNYMVLLCFLSCKWIISTKHSYKLCLDQSHHSQFIEFEQKPGSLKQNHFIIFRRRVSTSKRQYYKKWASKWVKRLLEMKGQRGTGEEIRH